MPAVTGSPGNFLVRADRLIDALRQCLGNDFAIVRATLDLSLRSLHIGSREN